MFDGRRKRETGEWALHQKWGDCKFFLFESPCLEKPENFRFPLLIIAHQSSRNLFRLSKTEIPNFSPARFPVFAGRKEFLSLSQSQRREKISTAQKIGDGSTHPSPSAKNIQFPSPRSARYLPILSLSTLGACLNIGTKTAKRERSGGYRQTKNNEISTKTFAILATTTRFFFANVRNSQISSFILHPVKQAALSVNGHVIQSTKDKISPQNWCE